MAYHYTYEKINEILSNIIKDIQITQVGKQDEIILSINYQQYIYQIEALIAEEIKKSKEKDKDAN